MTQEIEIQAAPANQKAVRVFLEICGDSFARVFSQLGRPLDPASVVPIMDPGPVQDPAVTPVSARFAASGALSGNFAFLIAPADAVRVSQVLLGGAPDGGQELNAEDRDACEEFFRQVAGLAATASTSLAGGTVSYQFQQAEAAAAKSTIRTGAWNLRGVGEKPLEILLELDEELHTCLCSKTVKEEAVPIEPAPVPPPAPAPALPQTVTEANLDILLDVVLDASLRFGQKQMMLKDVLELRPGSIVELDRQVQDPAELLVAGRVIAKGEVVVVDGNYGLRITEVAQPRDRLESLES